MARKLLVSLLVLALLLSAAASEAQKKKKKGKEPEPAPAPTEQPAAPAPSEPKADDVEQKKADARGHFERGLSLFDEEAWDAALVEFQRSREIFPTRAATKNAAICLRRLHRFDEALDMFDNLLREFPDLPPADKALVEREVSELRNRVGTVDIRMTEPGATIVIDGRDRGTSPPPAPLRVSVGSHLVRVVKKGFSTFEKRVDVSGGQNVPLDVKLAALTQAGTLRVTEKGGRAVDVVVDNVVVGQTPFEGPLPLGPHTVLLRGEGNLGTQPSSADIQLNQDTVLNLALEPLEAELRIEPQPVGAAISVDGVPIGRGTWDGRLRAGRHKIAATADGFLTSERQVTLAKGKRETVKLALERDPDSPMWQTAASQSGLLLEIDAGGLWTPSLGGDPADGCTGDCDKGFNAGFSGVLRIGYAPTKALALTLDLGYLQVQEKASGREHELNPVGKDANAGNTYDKLVLRGFTLGGSLGIRTASRWPLTFRAGGGVLFGTLKDTRQGRYTTNPNTAGQTATYRVDVEQSLAARYVYAAPEIRIGRRLGRTSELSFGVQGLFLFALTQPKWKGSDTAVLTGNCGGGAPTCITDGEATYADEDLTGSLVILIAPQLGFRQDF